MITEVDKKLSLDSKLAIIKHLMERIAEYVTMIEEQLKDKKMKVYCDGCCCNCQKEKK